jgi:hypothetical protein
MMGDMIERRHVHLLVTGRIDNQCRCFVNQFVGCRVLQLH